MNSPFKSKPTRNKPNWTAIEVPYRAGIMSVRQIARSFGISATAINKHADKHGWKRDLGAQVREAAQQRMASDNQAVCGNPTDNRENQGMQGAQEVGNRVISSDVHSSRARARENLCMTTEDIIAAASRLQADVVRTHKQDLARAQALCERLLAEGEAQTAHIDVILAEIELVTTDDRTESRARMLERAVSYASRVQSAKTLASAMAELVKLERQAYKISDDPADGGGEKAATLEERIKYYEKQEAIDASGGRVVPIAG